MSDNMPESWLPLAQWRQHWHYDKQKEYVKRMGDHWETLFLAGNGTGKSHIMYWSLICMTLGIHPYFDAEPPIRIKVLMHDFEHGYGKIFTDTCLRDQYMPDGSVIKPMLKEDTYLVTRFPSRDDKTIYFYNKSIMFFQTSEQKKKQHSGTNFDILACDEEPTYPIYDESKRGLRNAKGGGRILHAFTPPFDEDDKQTGPSWTKFKLVDEFEKGTDPDVFVVRAAMKDNPAITDDYIRKFCKGKSEEQIRIQLYGDYPTWGKMVFGDFEDHIWDPVAKKGHILPIDFEIPFYEDEIMFEMAVDWHMSKPAAVLWTFEYLSGPNKGDVVVWDELSPKQGAGLTISELKRAIREVEGWRNIKMRRYGDPKMKDKQNALISGFNAWDEFRHGDPKIRLTEGWNRDPGTGYSIVNDFLRGKTRGHEDHPRLFIRENCKTLRHNMKNHYWVVRKGDSSSNPDTKFNDYCVSLKYILQNKSRKLRKKAQESGQHSRWPLTSYGNEYAGTWIQPRT